jgi:hypothetical protein
MKLGHWAVIGLLVAAAAITISQYPDIARYIRMKTM